MAAFDAERRTTSATAHRPPRSFGSAPSGLGGPPLARPAFRAPPLPALRRFEINPPAALVAIRAGVPSLAPVFESVRWQDLRKAGPADRVISMVPVDARLRMGGFLASYLNATEAEIAELLRENEPGHFPGSLDLSGAPLFPEELARIVPSLVRDFFGAPGSRTKPRVLDLSSTPLDEGALRTLIPSVFAPAQSFSPTVVDLSSTPLAANLAKHTGNSLLALLAVSNVEFVVLARETPLPVDGLRWLYEQPEVRDNVHRIAALTPSQAVQRANQCSTDGSASDDSDCDFVVSPRPPTTGSFQADGWRLHVPADLHDSVAQACRRYHELHKEWGAKPARLLRTKAYRSLDVDAVDAAVAAVASLTAAAAWDDRLRAQAPENK